MIEGNKSAALKIITDRLADETPIILHDAHDSGECILFFKGLTALTLNRDLSAPENQGPIAAFLKKMESTLPFLFQNDLMSGEYDMHTIMIDGKEVTGLSVPGGPQAAVAIEKLYREYEIANPFTYVEAQGDEGMVALINQIQAPAKKLSGGLA